jgi:hypothetical protein
MQEQPYSGSTASRVAAAIRACRHEHFTPDPRGIAELLVDQDVARGDYDGCTSELESWFIEFEAEAARQLGVER